MKFRSDYYKKLKLSKAYSNMNRLCWELEKWDRNLRWKRSIAGVRNFDYTIMIDNRYLPDEEMFFKIEEVFLRFCKEMQTIKNEQSIIRKKQSDYIVNWNYYYELYKKECLKICPNEKMLANIAVQLCYEKYPKKSKNFIWRIAGEGVIKNIKQVQIELPIRCDDGGYEFLGRKYTMKTLENASNISASKALEYLDIVDNLEEGEEFFLD